MPMPRFRELRIPAFAGMTGVRLGRIRKLDYRVIRIINF
ncbi:Uncharacterized protein dnm_005820 [Desulfonema magnum]|uniref:Uncharacterized protein n=1 Tax=Desulfonema magnum TaxID=45655 RepID=A0A975GL93_9BACT|nr:Uncharacterized protein dnm_005820 [Desulfonema magnum]